MRFFVAIFFALGHVTAYCQVLTSVNLEIEIGAETVVAKELISISSIQPDDEVRLRTLELGEVRLSGFRLKVGGEGVIPIVERLESEVLMVLRDVADSVINVELQYQMPVQDDIFDLPVFFTNLHAQHSEADFFQATIQSQKAVRLIFPSIETSDLKPETLNFEPPALPSRLTLDISGEKVATVDPVDILVAGIFIAIGFIAYIRRKDLYYG